MATYVMCQNAIIIFKIINKAEKIKLSDTILSRKFIHSSLWM